MITRGASFTWKTRTARIAGFLRIVAFVPVGIGVGALFWFLPAAPSVAIVDAKIQSVSFVVAVPEMTRISLTGFALSYEIPEAEMKLGFQNETVASNTARRPLCLTGVVIPQPGTRVTYRRFGAHPVSVTFERPDGTPAVSFDITNGEAPAAASQSAWIHLQAHSDDGKTFKDNACEGESTKLLPIYGVTDLGTEMRPAGRGEEPSSALLLEGKIDIFGKTVEPGALREGVTRIYPANATSITIPPGSRITEAVKDGEPRQPWAGFAQVNADNALDVKVSTTAARLAIVRPGIGRQPEVLAMSLFTQLSNDPVLLSAQIFSALLFTALRMAGSAFALVSRAIGTGKDNDNLS
jgi:hypothetical protein